MLTTINYFNLGRSALMVKRKSSEDQEIIDGKIFAIISYLSIFCIIPLVLRKDNTSGFQIDGAQNLLEHNTADFNLKAGFKVNGDGNKLRENEAIGNGFTVDGEENLHVALR